MARRQAQNLHLSVSPPAHAAPLSRMFIARTLGMVTSSLVSRGIHVSDSGLLVKRAGPAAVAADADAAGDTGADED